MAEVYPFQGVRYNPTKVKDLSMLVSPPYDVITLKDQERFYRKDSCNVIRLILGKKLAGDDSGHNRYTRARDFFERWLEEGILKQDEDPSIYVYAQNYQLYGESYQRIGFICLVKLEDFGKKVVFPHEETFPKPKEDRLNLMRATNGNLSPIFALYRDEDRIITRLLNSYLKRKPLVDLVDEDRVRQRLWAITDRARIDEISRKMRQRSIFIADGHHRYETALAFRDEMAALKGFSGQEPWNRMMVCLVDMEDRGLIILPVHRLVRGLGGMSSDTLKERLIPFFEVRRSSPRRIFQQMKAKRSRHAFGMYHERCYWLLALKDESMIDEVVDPTRPREWRKLDVTILSSLIIEHCLGIKFSEVNIGYTKDRGQARSLVNKGDYEAAFFLNPVSPEEVKRIAWAHQLMPPKSTYFYPKLLTGLVINKF